MVAGSRVTSAAEQGGRRGQARSPLTLSIAAGVLAGLLALLLGGVLLARQPAQWTAGLPLLVQPRPGDSPDLRASYYEILIGGQVTATYAQLLADEPSLAAALSRADLPSSDAAVRAVTVTSVPGTTLLQVTATGPTAERASRAADAVAADAVARIGALQDPFVVEVPGAAAGSASQQGRGLPGLVVVALTAAGAAGLAVQQLVLRVLAARSRTGGAARPGAAATGGPAGGPVPTGGPLMVTNGRPDGAGQPLTDHGSRAEPASGSAGP